MAAASQSDAPLNAKYKPIAPPCTQCPRTPGLFNSLWIVTFVQGNDVAVWCSTFLILGLLASLCKIYLNTACWKGSRPGGPLQTLVLDIHISMSVGSVVEKCPVSPTQRRFQHLGRHRKPHPMPGVLAV